MMTNTKIENLLEDFALLDSWEEKYRYIIELGEALPAAPKNIQNENYKISGCVSQVWLDIIEDRQSDPNDPVFHFYGDADAYIVKGLISIIIAFYDKQKASWILANDPDPLLAKLDLTSHLSRQRANGLRAMINHIKAKAQAALGR